MLGSLHKKNSNLNMVLLPTPNVYLPSQAKDAVIQRKASSSIEQQKSKTEDVAEWPTGLYPAVISTIQENARSEDAYLIQQRDGVYHATNATQNFEVMFTPRNVTISRDGNTVSEEQWQLELLRCGYEDNLQVVEPAELVIAGNRIEYRRGPLTEWYINGPLGLEQGFTLTERPQTGDAGVGGSLILELRSSAGSLTTADGTSQIIWDTVAGVTSLLYGQLHVYDATNRELSANFEVDHANCTGVTGFIRICVDDDDAIYPLLIDPLIQQQELTGSNNTAFNRFGYSVSVSGNTCVVGAFGNNINRGAAYVFVRSDTTWVPQQILTASDAAVGDFFGYSVSVDGNTCVVGAPRKNGRVGAAYVFVRSDTTWTPQQTLTASEEIGIEFGTSVSVNGNTCVVGTTGVFQPFLGSAVYVFIRNSTTWTPQQTLVASDGISLDGFGFSVSVSGNTCAVGAAIKGNYRGAVYVFTRSGMTWTPQQILTASDGADGDTFGVSVSLNGNTCVVGAYFKNNDAGAAYVFTWNGTTWTPQQTLTASDGPSAGLFGFSVSVDGNMCVVGAYYKENTIGAAYVFTWNGTTWIPQQKLIASLATRQ